MLEICVIKSSIRMKPFQVLVSGSVHPVLMCNFFFCSLSYCVSIKLALQYGSECSLIILNFSLMM